MDTLRKLKKFNNLLSLDKGTLQLIGNCYGQFVEACLGSAGSNVISSNLSTYNVIMDTDIIDLMTLAYLGGKLETCVSSYPRLAQALDTRSDTYIQRLVMGNDMLSPISVDNTSDIITAVRSFGIAEATQDDFDTGEDIDNPELRRLVFGEEDRLEGLDDGEDIDTDIDPIAGDIGDEFEDEIDDGLNDGEDIEFEPSSEPDEEYTPDEPDDFSENFDDEIREIKSTWAGSLASIIDGIMLSYDTLYKSCYGLVAPSGILTDKGIVRTKADGTRAITGDRVQDISIFRAIEEALPGLFDCYASEADEPSIAQVGGSKHPITYVNMHLKFMFGHLNYCKGRKYGLRHYLTEHGIKNDSDIKIIKYSDIRGWIKETVERYFYKAYLDAGITDEVTPATMDSVANINQIMARSLRNIIAVVERKDKTNTRIRICTDSSLSVSSIISTLTKRLNVGASNNISVKQLDSYRSGVLDLNIIYNEKAYSQNSLFAYQVLDILETQGIKPSWDNVILGKKDDGTIMTYNFKNVESPMYALYAGSRSGKGVMTLNLLASAMADNCKIAYVDGKPEMAKVLADMAWKNGVDAFAFNGLEINATDGLENRGNCIRNVNRFMSKDDIPDEIFKTEDDLATFMLTVHYLRCMELVIKMAKARSDKCPSSDWMVVVFDECEQFASQESRINSVLDKAYDRRKKAIDPNDPKGTKKINITTDPAAQFIEGYREWRERLESDFLICVKSAFGKGNMTVFFVWQSSKFPNAFKNSSSLASMVESGRSKIVKIVGKDGVEQGGSTDFGNATTLKDMPWYDSRFDKSSSGGYFAIGGSLTKSMTVFRPFNIYSDSNGKDKILTAAKTAGLSESDLYGISLNPDGTVIHEVGFEGYADKLLSRFNMTASQQLALGYQYADELVRREGLGTDLCSFIYDAHRFASSKSSSGGYNFDGTNDTGMADELDSGDPLDFGGYDAPVNSDAPDDEDEDDTPDPSDQFGPGVKPSPPERALSPEDLEIMRRAQELKRRAAAAQATPVEPMRPDVPYYPDTDQPMRPDVPYYPDIDQPSSPDDVFSQAVGNTGAEPDYEGHYDDPVLEERAERRRVEFADRANPEVTTPNPDSAYSFGSANTGYCTFLSPSDISAVMGLNKQNSLIVTVKDHRSPKMSSRLFKTLRGTRYELESRWKVILNTIASEQNPGTIARVTICNDIMIFNNRQVAAIGLLGGQDGVEVVDVVNFTALAKKFPNIRELKIDKLVFGSATNEFPTDTVLSMFKTMKSLNKLSIWEPGYGVPPESFLRRDVIQGSASQHMRRAQEEEEFGKKLDILAAAKNPRFSRESSIDKHRILEGSKNVTGAGWNKCKQSFSNDHYVGGLVLGAFTIGAAAVTGALMGVGKLSSLIRGR